MKVSAAKSPGGRVLLQDVELFYSGDHIDSQGRPYACTPAHIDEVVRNFSLLNTGDRPILQPPVGIDHDTAKAIPDAALNPRLAFGQVMRVGARDQKIGGQSRRLLFGDIEVDPEIAAWVRKGRLRRLSPEIHDEPPPEGLASGAKGATLRRVALLGYDLPALKMLKPLPQPAAAKFSDQVTGRRFTVSVRCFAEPPSGAKTMTRDEMIAWLQQAGVDTSAITDAIPDSFLKMLCDALQKAGTVKASESPAGGAGGIVSGTPAPAPVPQSVLMKFSDFENTLKTFGATIQSIQQSLTADRQNHDTAARRARAANIRAFCDDMVEKKKMAVADREVDKDGNPMPGTELARLMRAADSPQLHAFSDGGKTVTRTELDVQMDEIKARKPRNFSEKVGAGEPGTLGGTDKAGFFKSVRERAVADRAAKAIDGPPLEQRLGMSVPAGAR